MGGFLNPGNQGFQRILNGKYIDKSGLISLINQTIATGDNLISVSRPRRFGKSYAAQMLSAYYDKTCDSSGLFDNLEIAGDSTYHEHLNRYDVIYLDMTDIKPYTDGYRNFLPYIQEKIKEDIKKEYPDVRECDELPELLLEAVSLTGNQFIMIIDEWDAIIREAPGLQKEYLEFLRALFKSSRNSSRIFAAVYMTGILPIKKDGSQSAISDFDEFTVISPWKYGRYVGFTEAETKELCRDSGTDFHKLKQWYDGYSFEGVGSVYNPNSVMKSVRYGRFDSYWTATSAAESLMKYISMGYAGLTKTVAELIGGIEVPVDTRGFSNDMVTFHGKDDVLTLLIHLGYLAYDAEKGTVRIPNEEIRLEFSKVVREVDHTETIKRLAESERLIIDTIEMKEEAVAAQIEKVHDEEAAPLHYNREDSLRSVIKLAYYAYKDYYLQWEELPAGRGYADVVYLPKQDLDYPALVIELKWNQSAEGAIDQILKKKYPDALKGYGRDILLVGISYNKDVPAEDRKHSCKIRKAGPGL